MKSISPLRFPGGKTRACKTFMKYLPEDVKIICSPFFGGGSFELYCLINYCIRILAYDLFESLVVFWNCLLEDSRRLADSVSRYLPVVTKEQFYRLQRTFEQIKDPWERAGATFILNRTSFSGAMASGGFSPLENGKNGRFNENNVEFIENFRVPKEMLTVKQASFEVSIPRHPDEFLFLDPPYMVESKLYGRRGDLQNIDHELLADMLHSRGNWMLCYNDCVQVKRLYHSYVIIDDRDGVRCARYRVHHLAVRLQYPRSKPFTNEADKRFIIDAFSEHPDHPFMIYSIEEASDIRFHNPAIFPSLKHPGEVRAGILWTAIGTIPIAEVQEILLIDSFEDFGYCDLQQLVLSGRDPQGTLFPIRFGNITSPHQLRSVSLTLKTLNEIANIGLQVLLVIQDIHSICARCCVLPQEREAPSQIRLIEKSGQVAEPMLLVGRCPICYSPQ